MNRILKQLRDDARRVHLTEEERSAMRQTLFAAMAAHPLPERFSGAPRRSLWRVMVTPLYLKYLLHPMPIAILILILLSGGAAAAAEGALPGQALYPVKVEINEAVRG